MKITKIEDLHCNAGWRNLSFLKIETDVGITGYEDRGTLDADSR